MTDLSAQTEDLRDQIAQALTEWTLTAASGRPDAILLPRDAETLRNNSLARADVALSAITAAGYRLCRDITPEQEAEDAQAWG